MDRFEDWPTRLASLIKDAQQRPFSYGSHDCCLFAADAVMAMTGIDPAASLRGEYKTEREAFSKIKKFGGVAGVAEKLATEHGMYEVPVNFAGRGDVALLHIDQGDVLGVVECGRVFVAALHGGLVTFDMGHVIKVWRV